MIVINMWFIKHTNGLFHYGMDYAEALDSQVREIWVKSNELARAARRRIPDADVRVLNGLELIASLAGLRHRGDLLFTPTSHPLALISRQVVVVHDEYPFAGRMGWLKLALLRAGLALSGGTAAYINSASGKPFLQRTGLAEERTRYLPNRLAAPVRDRRVAPLVVGDRLVVGLFGSDSPKKNYDALFAAFSENRAAVPVTWRIYGHANEYTTYLRNTYPALTIEIAGSDIWTMDAFIDSIDLAVSIAREEGFARPVALALMRGVPTLLLDTPVFREFYAGSAQMFAEVEGLVATIASLRQSDHLERPRLNSEGALRADFGRAVAWLESRAQ